MWTLWVFLFGFQSISINKMIYLSSLSFDVILLLGLGESWMVNIYNQKL
jgi:hypothetical protein